jgi:hypothetical protein
MPRFIISRWTAKALCRRLGGASPAMSDDWRPERRVAGAGDGAGEEGLPRLVHERVGPVPSVISARAHLQHPFAAEPVDERTGERAAKSPIVLFVATIRPVVRAGYPGRLCR